MTTTGKRVCGSADLPNCLLTQLANNGDDHLETTACTACGKSIEELDGEFKSIAGRLKERTENQLKNNACLKQIEEAVTSSQYKHRSLPKRVGEYEICSLLGQGGMGIVYEARHETLDRRVALKLLPGGWNSDSSAVERFHREAKAAAKLHHSNIVPVFDVGESDGVQYYAMQLITGSPVHLVIKEVDKLRKSGQTDLDEGELSTQSSRSRSTNSVPPTPGSTQNVAGATVSTSIIDPASTAGSAKERQTYYLKVARIGKQVAQALEYAHQHGVIHRDIKPSNLIVDIEGNPWVTDFGLAKTDDDGLTQTGNVVGTLRYIAPERFEGQCDERSDIYSLGMTLYEMLALKPAFETSNQIQLLQKIKDTEPSQLKTFDPKIPRDMQTIISRAINKDPRHRYQSAAALAKDLTFFLDDQPITARFVPAWEKLWFWARKHKQLATALVAISSLMMAALVASALAANYYFKKERQQQLLANANENLAIEMEVQRDGAFYNAYLADMRAAAMTS